VVHVNGPDLGDVTELTTLARLRGVQLSHADGLGRVHTVSVENLLRVLNGFGDLDPMVDPRDAVAALRQFRQARIDRILEPVYLVDEGLESRVPVHLVRRTAALECRLEFEFGGESSWSVRPDELASFDTGPEGGRAWSLALPALPVGYHRLCVLIGRRMAWSTVMVRPLRGVTHRFTRDWRAYAVQAPVFSLHSARSWGSGDVGDLDEFARLVANQGATVVATLPLLSSFGPGDFDASPYRPVSRRFWNDRWIALDQVGDLAHSPAARFLMNETYPPDRRATWSRDGIVDGAAAFAAKRNVIQTWAATESEFMVQHETGLRAFVMNHPEVNDYARFRAAGERFGRDFNLWPSTARSGLLRWNDVDPTLVRYHLFAQWIIDGQMSELSARLAQRGQTLQLDIPIGVHPHGYDVWKSPDEFVSSMSIGSPPDDFSREGQNWGTPPPNPARGRENVHFQFREALRSHMSVAGVVRIDHVMGLQRLFWVPEGAPATDGVYVSMPFRELLGVIAIEAQRHGVDVVGEDLGTVDPELRGALEHEGLRRSHVVQFSIGEHALDPVPPGAMASFDTHDTATFYGWWTGADIDERVAVGHLAPSEVSAVVEERDERRRRLVAALGLEPDAEPEEVLDAVYVALADSAAGLVMVEVEDILKATAAVNLPGTDTERPNWCQQTSLSLEEMGTSSVLADALRTLRERRGFATSGSHRHRPSQVTRLSDEDVHLFNEGRHFRLYEHLGCHAMIADGVAGCYFAVWAPNAERVAVVGDFNDWDGERHPLTPRDSSGIWEGFVAGATAPAAYKYRIRSRLGGHEVDKADPMGRYFEVPSNTATRVWSSDYEWRDGDWMAERGSFDARERPVSVYEVHLGSWRRVPEDGGRSLTYLEMAEQLPRYCTEMGFSHVQFMPVMEHPFYGSWGYQSTGYFAPTSRYGTPDDFKHLVDRLHQAGVGVLLDWVPSHFPSDEHALGLFDGTHLYEHADVRQRVHPDWQSWTFNYGRNEVRSFLISSACFWLDEYHADGLRLDAVASMLYLDYSRGPGEWIPNQFGGREDLAAVEFLRQCNDATLSAFPGVIMIAEESTSWPGVTRPGDDGGLGFTFKWDMGWMHDTLQYMERDPIHRRFHHDELTFRGVYAAHERFMLPLSHDEVVHGKGSLLGKMPGDEWQARANLRLLLGYQFTIPGKKLLFMGAELGQWSEWSHERSLDWHLLEHSDHEGMRRWVERLNEIYRVEEALHLDDASWPDFGWLSSDDAAQSVLVWRRGEGEGQVVVVANFTPVPRVDYEFPVPSTGAWSLIANSDDVRFGGSGYPCGDEWTTLVDAAGASVVRMSLPPLSLVALRRRS